MDLQIIQKRIYFIRNQRIMLDFIMAALYEVETKKIERSGKAESQKISFRLYV